MDGRRWSGRERRKLGRRKGKDRGEEEEWGGEQKWGR